MQVGYRRLLRYNRVLVPNCPDLLHPEFRMSHHDHHPADSLHEPDPADSRADAVAAFFAIAIAVCGVLFFISQHSS